MTAFTPGRQIELNLKRKKEKGDANNTTAAVGRWRQVGQGHAWPIMERKKAVSGMRFGAGRGVITSGTCCD